MKKIIFAIAAIVLLFTGCSKDKKYMPQIYQNPYRLLVEYEPESYTIEVPGTVEDKSEYSWVSVSQNGNQATFTLRRNTWDSIRQAEFAISGCKDKAVVIQKGHALDAALDASLNSQKSGEAEIACMMGTNYYDDYAGWGFLYGTSADPDKATAVPQKGKPVIGNNVGTVTGLKDGTDYFVWAYAESTEGNRKLSNMVAILPPVYVKAGEDLQAAIDGAKEYSTIMIQGGTTFQGGIAMLGNNKNKTLSGGWNADFSKQSMETLTVIDGKNKFRGFTCCENASDEPLTGYVKLSYFEIINCAGDHGSAVHVCGGPVTVNNCYIHDNNCEKGAIGTREEVYSSDITVYNCILTNNTAAGHGPVFGFGDGKSYDDQVKATIVSNLIVNNVSNKKDGYCSVFICYNNTDLVFVNNTVYGNMNYEEYGGEYSGIVLRGNVRSLFANNILVGFKTSKNTDVPEYYPMVNAISLGGSHGTMAYNIIESGVKDSANATFTSNQMLASGASLNNVMVDAAAGNYNPTGIALGSGFLGNINYKESRDGAPKTCDVKALLDKYSKDLNGNPRVTNGKVDCGCIQAQ